MRIGSIVVHTPEFDQTVAFWRAALHYVPREEPQAGWVVLRDRRSGLGGPALLGLGARRYPWRYRAGADFVVLEDPGGNLFCVVAKPDLPPD
jgi:catechol 2,3-dioxygenase-like lactoylglutathione lyase family enzyme